MGRWLKGLGIVFTAALAVVGVADKFGVTSFIPSFDSGFDASLSANGRLVRSTIDMGNTDCWLRLTFRTANGVRPSLSATLGKQQPLDSDIEQQQSGLWTVVVSSAPAAGRQNPRVFTWPTGQELTLESRSGKLVALESWELHDSSKGTDSSYREMKRTVAQTVWTGLLVLSILLTGVGYLLPSERVAPWQNQVLLVVINAVEGSSKRQTRLIHDLLVKIVINGAPLEEAVASLQLTGRDQRVVPQRAFAGFRRRLNLLQQTIERFRSVTR